MKTLLVLLALILLWDAAWLLAGLRQTLPWDLRGRLAAGENILLLDVRTPQEFNWFHIPGAINAPFGSTGLTPCSSCTRGPAGLPQKWWSCA